MADDGSCGKPMEDMMPDDDRPMEDMTPDDGGDAYADDAFRAFGHDSAMDDTVPETAAADETSADASDDASTDKPDGEASPEPQTAKRCRPKPLVIALVAAFAAGAVFAGTAIGRSILETNARDHAAALADCRDARTRYRETLAGYTPVAGRARTLLNDTTAIEDSETRDRLQQQMDHLDAADVTGPADLTCAADMKTEALTALADRYAKASSAMEDGLISIRYDEDVLRQMKDGLDARDVRERLTALIARARLAYDRSAGKADETARGALKDAIDLSQTVLDTTPSDESDAVGERIQPLSEATAAVIALLPLDCHFTDCVALTFDDGPNKTNTPKILDALKQEGVPATFFLQGQFVSGSNVKLVRRMTEEGHSVGSMSWRHTPMHEMPADQLAKWFDDTDGVISEASGKPVTLFRPPDGAWGETLRAQAETSGQAMILWGVDSGDWDKIDAEEITRRTLEAAYAGSIICLHDGNAETAKALPDIIEGLQEKGYRLVTVDTLLDGDIRPGSVAYGLNDVQ